MTIAKYLSNPFKLKNAVVNSFYKPTKYTNRFYYIRDLMSIFFPFIDTSPLIDLLSVPNSSLQTILDQDSLLPELKSSNPLLLNYFCKPSVFNSLIQFITEIPKDLPFSPSTSQKDYSQNKYPFIACEILSLENHNIAQYLLGIDPKSSRETEYGPIWNKLQQGKTPQNQDPENKMPAQSQEKENSQEPPLLNLLKFLDSPTPLNPTLAGYFAKILRSLIYFKSEYTTHLLFKTYSEYLKKLNTHIYCDSIQELLSIIVKLETSYFCSQPQERYLTERQNIVKATINSLFTKSSNDQEISHHQLVNSSHLLVNLISSSEHLNDGAVIISSIFQRDILEKLLKGLTNADMINIFVPVIEQLCKYYIHKYSLPWNPTVLEFPFGQESIPEVNIQDSEPFINEIIKAIPSLVNILKRENKDLNPTPIKFQYGITGYSFGNARVKLIETIYCFFKLQNLKLNTEIKNSGLVPILLKLFTKNPWSSILHMNLLKIFVFIIQAGSEPLKRHLFDQAKILEFIIQAHKDSFFRIPSKLKGAVQKGYMSHLLVLANKIDQSSHVLIHNYTRRSSEWLPFKKQVLEESNKKNAVVKESSKNNSNSHNNQQQTIASPNIFEEQDIFTTESLTKNEAFAALLGLNTASTPPPHCSKEEFKLELNSPCDPHAGQKLFNFGLSKQLRVSGHSLLDDDVISPTFSDNFGDYDIKEREDCEIKYPQSVEIKEGFVSCMSQSNFQDELFEMVIESPKKIVSPKLDSLKLLAKTIEDEKEELIY